MCLAKKFVKQVPQQIRTSKWSAKNILTLKTALLLVKPLAILQHILGL